MSSEGHILSAPGTSRPLLQRAAHPEGTSSFRLFRCFLFYPVHTLLNIFSSGYFIPLCLCDFSLHCIRIQSLSAFEITQCSSCLSWGAYRESLGPPFSFYKCFLYWECTITYYICILHIIPRSVFGGPYIFEDTSIIGST